ncbi:MAG: ABC transporter ATP-binding protein [Oscillospiraceae bacterium]|nr:ABC transporter ATP-binding protein [Oscillospiraceae bacterium]
MQNMLEVSGLRKKFGSTRALDGADMALPEGSVTGLLGPNASGKTTLLKIAAGLLHPASGQVRWPGGAAGGPRARASTAFCPDTLLFPHGTRVRGAFAFYRDMYPDYSQARADELIAMLGLGEYSAQYVAKLSKGTRERLAVALTFSRHTSLYLLDEPLDGIDPLGKTKIIDAVIALKPESAAVLISTHMVRDLERIFTHVYFLSKGKTVFSGECDAMREASGRTVEQAYLEVFTHEGSA